MLAYRFKLSDLFEVRCGEVMLGMVGLISECIEKEDKIKGEINMKNITISAEAFKNGETIPDEYTCEGNDISPALSFDVIPDKSVSLALIMDDPDAPGGTFVHWLLFNISPKTRYLSKGIPKTETLSDFSRQGVTDFGEIGYGGPCPPPGKPHRYFFRIYALDKILELMPGASRTQIDNAMKDHIIAKGELMGIYRR